MTSNSSGGFGGGNTTVDACDVVIATMTGTVAVLSGPTGATLAVAATAYNAASATVPGPFAGPVLKIQNAGLAPVNDTVDAVLVGFGNGYEEYGLGPSQSFVNEETGHYEALVIYQMQSGARIGRTIEFDWDKTAQTFSNIAISAGTNAAGYEVSAARVWAQFDAGGAFVGAFTAAGPYVVIGGLRSSCPIPPQAPFYEGDDFRPQPVVAAVQYGVIGDGFQIAGPTRAALPAFNGAPDTFDTSAIGGMLQSVTVTAFSSQAGLPGLTANQVVVSMPGGNKINLAPGETRTWSVEREQDQELKREYSFVATGNAYATITWTVV
jgi:hypothetical protein